MAAGVESQLPPGFEIDPPHQQGGNPGHLLPPGFEVDKPEMTIGRQLLGNAELGGAAIANIPHGIIHAATDIYNKVTGKYGDEGKDPGWLNAIHVEPGEAGKQLSDELGNSLTSTIDSVVGQDRATHAVGATNEAVDEHPIARDVVAPLANDVVTLAGVRAPITSAVRSGVNAVKNAAAEASGAGTDWSNAGLRTGGGHPIAREVAGSSGQEALTTHNTKVGNVIASTEAGHPTDAPISYDSLAESREAPNSVYNRVAHDLPEGQLDEAAQSGVQNAGAPEGGRITKGSPQAQQQIADLKAQLLDPKRNFTGPQMVNELRGLRQEGYANAASEDVSNQQLGRAQLDMARALEGHIGRNLPQGGSVNLEQFQTARTALAKSHAVQAALRGNDVDLAALGRIHRNNPTEFTGGLKTLAEFAEGPGKDVVGIPNRYNPPNVLSDMAGVVNIHRPVQSTIQGIPGFGSTARRLLTGSTRGAIEKALQQFPGNGPDAFRPLPGLTPPPGVVGRSPPIQGSLGDLPQGPGPAPFTTGTGANPTVAAPAARPGDIPLSEVLAHGVEKSPPAGLTAGPMGASAPQGLPFTASPDMVGARPVQGGAPKLLPRVTDDYGNEVNPNTGERPKVTLGDRFATKPSPGTKPVNQQPRPERSLGDLLGDLQDYSKVVSQGVPEDIAARSRPGNQRTQNNASGESSASVEAINRDKIERAEGKDRFLVDPDGKVWPIRGVDAVDFKPQKGSIVVQKGVGSEPYSILDRGGLPHAHAKGLLNRALAGGTGLSLGDLLAAQ